MPAAFAQKPLLLPNPIPFPHHPDTYNPPTPTPSPTPSLQPQPQFLALPPFLQNLFDNIPTLPNLLLLLLIAVFGNLVLHGVVVLVRRYARARAARRELRRALVERMEKAGMDDGEEDED